MLRRCLKKDRQQRLQDATGVRIEIEDVLSGALPAEPVAAAKGRSRERLTLAAGLVLAVGALGALSLVHFREVPPAAAPEMRTEIVTPSTSTSDPVSFALSPDGRQIVFVASGDGPLRLWLRRLDATSAQPLAGTEERKLSLLVA